MDNGKSSGVTEDIGYLDEPIVTITNISTNTGPLPVTYDVEFSEEELQRYVQAPDEPDLTVTPYDFNYDCVCVSQTRNPFKKAWSHWHGRRLKYFIKQYEKWSDQWFVIDENYSAMKIEEFEATRV